MLFHTGSNTYAQDLDFAGGGLAVSGSMELNGTAAHITVRLERSGNVVWNQTRIAGGWANGLDVAGAPSGEVYALGLNSTVGGTSASNGSLLKYDPGGTLRWSRNWSIASEGEPRAVDEDGGFAYVVGVVFSPTYNNIFLRKYDPVGNLVWKRTLAVAYDEWVNDVAATPGGLYIAGKRAQGKDSLSPGCPLAAKFTLDGDLIWEACGNMTYPYGILTAVSVDGEDSYYAGTLPGTGSYWSDYFVRRVDPNGRILWERGHEPGHTFTLVARKGVVHVAGLDQDSIRVWRFLADGSGYGNLSWQDPLRPFIRGSVGDDAGLYLAGAATSPTDGKLDLFFLAIDSQGPGPEPPGAPSLDVEAWDSACGLEWTPPNSTGGPPVTNYLIYRGPTKGGETQLAEVGDVTTFRDDKLTNGKTYYYQVSAKNSAGEGKRSAEKICTPAADRGPPPAEATDKGLLGMGGTVDLVVLAAVITAIVAMVVALAFISRRKKRPPVAKQYGEYPQNQPHYPDWGPR